MNTINSKSVKTKPFNGIIVFGRYPRAGSVKTRLGKMIGSEKAAAIYERLLRHSLNQARGVKGRIHRYLYIADKNDVLLMKKWAKGGFFCFAQCSGDLGERIKEAIDSVMYYGAKKVIIIGSDTPGISSSLLEEAFNSLDGCDVVIGPATDGGYYLLGLKTMRAQLFKGINWSTKNVFEQTLKRAKDKRLSVYKTRELSDIDTGDDLKRWLDRQDDKRNILAGL